MGSHIRVEELKADKVRQSLFNDGHGGALRADPERISSALVLVSDSGEAIVHWQWCNSMRKVCRKNMSRKRRDGDILIYCMWPSAGPRGRLLYTFGTVQNQWTLHGGICDGKATLTHLQHYRRSRTGKSGYKERVGQEITQRKRGRK
jgi:hypothetical protein